MFPVDLVEFASHHLVGLLTMDGLLCVRSTETHYSSNTTSTVCGVERRDERGDARIGKWDESNLVLFNLVHHHQEREDEVTRLATSAATDLFIHTGRVHYSGVVLHHRVWLVGGS